jgi:hypothetical protein
MSACACGVSAISASSATNAWATGTIYTVNGPGSLYWNGRQWSFEPPGPGPVSTSGPHNTWGLGGGTSGYDLLHWNGTAWDDKGTTPSNVMLTGIATTSAKLVYAVGEAPEASTGKNRPVVMRFNGKAWSEIPVNVIPNNTYLTNVAMHGDSVWIAGLDYTASSRSTVIVHSTGGRWKVQQRLGRNFSLDSLSAVATNRSYAGGQYYDPNTMGTRSFLDYYNGHSWKAVSSKL